MKLGFVTLTYSEEFLPEYGTLVKKDVSIFFKDLRTDLGERKIRHFTCGEYGSKTNRAHYHSVVFGLKDTEEDRRLVFENWKKCDYDYFFGRKWKKCYGTVTPDSCSYVAGYCQKKKFGHEAKALYEDKNRIPPFQIQSQHLGEQYFLDNYEKIVRDGYILYGGKKCSIPQTFKRKYNLNFSDTDYMLSHKLEIFALCQQKFGDEFTKTLDDFLDSSTGNDFSIWKNHLTEEKRQFIKSYCHANREFRERMTEL